jgi:hypothetical protein
MNEWRLNHLQYFIYKETIVCIFSDCFQLVSTIQSTVSGSYYKVSDSLYARLDLLYYFYLYFDAFANPFWVIGPTVQDSQIVMYSYDVLPPQLPPPDWQTFNGVTFVPENVSITQQCFGELQTRLFDNFCRVDHFKFVH